jgi:4-amino-4-deoxy-L-arabinose transferase-like glycosyltransferase
MVASALLASAPEMARLPKIGDSSPAPSPASQDGAGTLPPARPRLLPRARWAKLALAFLLVFTLVRGGMWAMTQPYFWAPDEDYHFLYVEYLTTQHALPSPDKPLYPDEYPLVIGAMKYDQYSSGPRVDFSGDPKASVRRLDHLPAHDRDPHVAGRGVAVVHAPLYYLAGALVNGTLDDRSPFTRIAAVRWVSSVFGVLFVFCAWLLAAQVFRREFLQLTVALLVAVQPMVGFISGIVSNDIAVSAGFAGALALLLFLVRTPPRAAQGLWVGGAIALALLVKSTALALLPLAVLAYLAQGLTWRDRWREALRSAAIALGAIAVLAGWWYVRSVIVYGSATGQTTQVVPHGSGEPVSHVFSLISEWTRLTYRTYWWHFYWWEAPRNSIWFFLPYAVGAVGALGLALAVWRYRRALLDAREALLRQIILMVLAILILYVPPLTADVLRRLHGTGFILVAGRFLLPAYPAAAALLVVGLRQLFRRRLLPWACGIVMTLACAFCWHIWTDTYVHRYFGRAGWGELFRRMSFDRPEFVTPTTYWIALIVIGLSLAGFFALMAAPWWQGRRNRPAAGGAEAVRMESRGRIRIPGSV